MGATSLPQQVIPNPKTPRFRVSEGCRQSVRLFWIWCKFFKFQGKRFYKSQRFLNPYLDSQAVSQFLAAEPRIGFLER
jgi:hypothetical protein